MVEELAGVADIHRCLNFVTSQYPHLNAGLSDIINRLSNVLLQLVFNSCRAKKVELNFELL